MRALPKVTDQTKFIGVDMGYGTAGMTIATATNAGVVTLEKVVAFRQAGLKKDFRNTHASEDQCHTMAANILLASGAESSLGLTFRDGQFTADYVWFLEDWRGGQYATTTRWRGYFDCAFAALLRQRNMPYFWVQPAVHKQMLHPEGKARDNGRADLDAYWMHLNTLDNIITHQDMEQVVNPILPHKARQWKDAKQHTLDSLAICVAGFLAVHLAKGTPYPLKRPQLQTAQNVARALGFL